MSIQLACATYPPLSVIVTICLTPLPPLSAIDSIFLNPPPPWQRLTVFSKAAFLFSRWHNLSENGSVGDWSVNFLVYYFARQELCMFPPKFDILFQMVLSKLDVPEEGAYKIFPMDTSTRSWEYWGYYGFLVTTAVLGITYCWLQLFHRLILTTTQCSPDCSIDYCTPDWATLVPVS